MMDSKMEKGQQARSQGEGHTEGKARDCMINIERSHVYVAGYGTESLERSSDVASLSTSCSSVIYRETIFFVSVSSRNQKMVHRASCSHPETMQKAGQTFYDFDERTSSRGFSQHFLGWKPVIKRN